MRNGLLPALTLVCASLVVGCAAPSAQTQDLSTPDGALFLTIDLQVDPEKVDEFLAIMIEAAPDTRAREGCRLFRYLRGSGQSRSRGVLRNLGL